MSLAFIKEFTRSSRYAFLQMSDGGVWSGAELTGFLSARSKNDLYGLNQLIACYI